MVSVTVLEHVSVTVVGTSSPTELVKDGDLPVGTCRVSESQSLRVSEHKIDALHNSHQMLGLLAFLWQAKRAGWAGENCNYCAQNWFPLGLQAGFSRGEHLSKQNIYHTYDIILYYHIGEPVDMLNIPFPVFCLSQPVQDLFNHFNQQNNSHERIANSFTLFCSMW